MYAVATFLIVALLALLFTRLVTGALISTGMPPQIAAFQARSAFTGAGFTTTEAENVVNHPVRRRVISTTMFVGNLGVPTLVVTVLLGLLAPGPGDTDQRLLVLIGGLAVIVAIMFTPPVTRAFVDLGRRLTAPRVRQAIGSEIALEHALGGGVGIYALPLTADPGLRSIRGLQQALPQLQVIGVRRDGNSQALVYRPPADVELHADDVLLAVAESKTIEDLKRRDPA